MSPRQDFHPLQAEEIARAFLDEHVEYLFLGKSGAILLGYPGTTQDVIASKRASGRQKDLIEIPLLEAFRVEYEKLHSPRLRSAAEISRHPPER